MAAHEMSRYRLPATLLLLLPLLSSALDNGLAATPPLAYSTWNMFNDATNDTLIRELGDALVSTGLAGVGYRTLNIDAGYLSHERHPTTHRLQAGSHVPFPLPSTTPNCGASSL